MTNCTSASPRRAALSVGERISASSSTRPASSARRLLISTRLSNTRLGTGSGSIATAFRNIYQGLLGAQAHPEGLDIAPCLPAEWEKIAGRIIYAGRPLNIDVRRDGARYVVAVNGREIKDGRYRPKALQS